MSKVYRKRSSQLDLFATDLFLQRAKKRRRQAVEARRTGSV